MLGVVLTNVRLSRRDVRQVHSRRSPGLRRRGRRPASRSGSAGGRGLFGGRHGDAYPGLTAVPAAPMVYAVQLPSQPFVALVVALVLFGFGPADHPPGRRCGEEPWLVKVLTFALDPAPPVRAGAGLRRRPRVPRRRRLDPLYPSGRAARAELPAFRLLARRDQPSSDRQRRLGQHRDRRRHGHRRDQPDRHLSRLQLALFHRSNLLLPRLHDHVPRCRPQTGTRTCSSSCRR